MEASSSHGPMLVDASFKSLIILLKVIPEEKEESGDKNFVLEDPYNR